MKVLKVFCGRWENPSRDLRELGAAQKAGFKVSAVIKNGPEIDDNSIAYGISAKGINTKPLGNHRLFRLGNYLISIVIWSWYISKRDDDILSCHDLPALAIGNLSNFLSGRKKKKLLIYDSHELEIGRAVKRSALKKWCVLKLEQFLVKRTEQTILVNNAIAEEFTKIHYLKRRPVVARNIPKYWEVNNDVCKKIKNEICTKMKISKETFLLMYHGMVKENRGIEILLDLLTINTNIAVVVLGSGNSLYVQKLKEKAMRLSVQDRVLFIEAIEQNNLWKYVGAVDLGVILAPNFSKSYYLSLPNKLFENIQSETPIIGSNFPEIEKIIKTYKIGKTCVPDDVQQVNSYVEEMRLNQEKYLEYKKNLKIAKQELCWENEEKVLIQMYKDLGLTVKRKRMSQDNKGS